MSYKTEKAKFIKLVKKYDETYDKKEKSYDELKNMVSFESIKERFKSLGEVELKEPDHWYDTCRIYLKTDLTPNGLDLIRYSKNDKGYITKYNIPFENKDFNVFSYITLNCSTIDELENQVPIIKNFIKSFEEIKSKEPILDKLNEVLELSKQYDELDDKIDLQYDVCRNAFVEDNYGCGENEIAIGKTYFLLDTKLETKIAMVEVLSKDASGIGYKCVDHEADDKKYSHVKPSRLRADLRDFPSRWDLRAEARGKKDAE